jgi:hypothetical protein
LFLWCRYFQHTHIIETVTWISIKQILKDHRSHFLVDHKWQIRSNTITTIDKVLDCGSWKLWSMTIKCDHCHISKNIPFTCKSRFCNSCSKAASDKWLWKLISRRPQWLHYHHLIFTIPEELRSFFKRYRSTLKIMSLVASNAVKYFFKQKYKCIPWIVNVIHTFWAKLNRNTHIHMILTAWWITSYNTFRSVWYIPYLWIVASRKGFLLKSLNERVCKNLTWNKLLDEIDYLKRVSNLKNQFNDKKSRYVYFSEKADSFQKVLSYIGRYLKRPVIAQSRIKRYEWENVIFEYVDKHDGEKKNIFCSAKEFIWLLVQHIPQKHFKMIYYGWIFSHRTKKKYLPIIMTYTWKQELKMKIAKYYRWRMLQFTGIDIWKCSCWWLFKKYSISIPWYNTIFFNSS